MAGEPERIRVVGGGAVAHALGSALDAAGWSVEGWARRRETAVGLPVELRQVAASALVLVCVRDDAIGEVASRLAEVSGGAGPARVALHTSGYHGADVLEPLARVGWRTGGLHPLRAFPPRRPGSQASAPQLAGTWCALDGDPEAMDAGRRLVRAIGGRELALAPGAEARARYHAAATLAAGGSVALLDAALELLGASAVDPHAARGAFADLARGALANVAARGAAEALTGPIARGDVAVVAGHLASAAAAGPRVAALYRVLAARARDLVAAELDPDATLALARLLDAREVPGSESGPDRD